MSCNRATYDENFENSAATFDGNFGKSAAMAEHSEHSDSHSEHSEKHFEHSEKHSEHSEKHDNGATLVGNSGNNVIFEGRNSGEGGSGNSATISAEFLGLLKTSNIY